jgi:hypothetical protein
LNGGLTSVARQIGMRDHEAEVKFVLESFFSLIEDGWVNARADKEIAHFKGKIEQASKAGKASAERRFNGRSTDVQPTNNQEPITNNHKPIKNTVAPPDGVTDIVWQDWLTLRKSKKAAVTQTALNGIIKEAGKAGISLQTALETCCARGWTGFKAEWLKEKDAGQKSFAEKEYDFKRKRWEAMTGRTSEYSPFLEIEDDTTH